jgi:hypothetical protein
MHQVCSPLVDDLRGRCCETCDFHPQLTSQHGVPASPVAQMNTPGRGTGLHVCSDRSTCPAVCCVKPCISRGKHSTSPGSFSLARQSPSCVVFAHNTSRWYRVSGHKDVDAAAQQSCSCGGPTHSHKAVVPQLTTQSRLIPHAISRDAAAEPMMVPRWQGPTVDWSRYHLQVLFVDHSDVLRAKLAAAFFEQVRQK